MASGMLGRRGLLLGAGVLLVASGGGRLFLDEVRLLSQQAETAGLRQRAARAHTELERVVRLERDLAHGQRLRAGLQEQLGAAQAEERRLHDRQAQLEDELTRARDELVAQGHARAEAQREVAAREAELEALGRTQRAAAAQVLKLTRAEETARRELAARAEELRGVQQQLAARERELSQSHETLARTEAELATRGEALAQSEAALNESRAELQATRARERAATELAQARAQELTRRGEALARSQARAEAGEARAEAGEARLARLEAAGINVARLTGERPMPLIAAIVVRVDAAEVPPLVLVDAGSEEGLEVRDLLFVLREGREVARLEVEEVRPHLAQTRLVRGLRGLVLRPGDAVSSRLPASK